MRDITFSINANYFLFATLEQARVIASGRNMPENQAQLTVLTGTPVSGMVLLDRPSPAGYFIFPDLSVRHEGKFRLSFSLYEELKNPQEEDSDESLRPTGGAHVTHRLEVKSQPFTVYSAKKFPGLTESTSLSRMVAEQGCRVRIRRDVRMRRRDQKSGKEWDGYEDEIAEARARMSATPEVSAYQGLPPPKSYIDPISRPRSSSITSHHSLAPTLSTARRPSLQDLGYQQSGYGTAPHTPQSAYPQPSPYGPSPTQQYGSAPFMQQQTMQPPPPTYPQHSYQPPTHLPQSAPSQPNYYSYGASATPTHPQVSPGAPVYEPHERQHRQSTDSVQMSNDHRRSSEIGYGPPPPRPAQVPEFSYPSNTISQSGYQSQSQPSYSSHHGQQSSYGSSEMYGSRVGPPEPVQPPTRPTYSTPPFSARPFSNQTLPLPLPPVRAPPPLNTSHTVINAKQLEPSSPASSIQPSSYYSAVQTPNDSHKRGFGQVFNDNHTQQPLRQGARPSIGGHYDYPSSYYGGADVEGDGNDTHQLKMSYKRSDGSKVERTMPTHQSFA